MSEQGGKLSRRDFVKLVGVGFVATTLPKALSRLDQKVQNDINKPDEIASAPQVIAEAAKEEEPQKGMRIMDNVGIKKDGQLVDVLADESLIKENILSRAH